MPAIINMLAGFDAIWSLIAISAILGIGMLWTFGRLSDQAAIKRTRNRLKANLLEMRLFGDEPALVFRAQKDLLVGNLRLLALTLKPAIVLSVPMVLLLSYLDPFYGRLPLPVGQPAILTVHMRKPLDPGAAPPRLEAPAGITVETPAVWAAADGDLSWRIRPDHKVDGTLRVILANEVVEKRIAAGAERGYASEVRGSSWSDWLLHPGESRLASPAVDSIAVTYPTATVAWLGLELHWIVWLLIVSIVTALLFKRRMGVSF